MVKKFMNKNTRKRKRNTRKGKGNTRKGKGNTRKGIRSKRTMRTKNNQRTMRKKNRRRSETGGLPSPKSDAQKIAQLILEEGFDDMPLDTSLGFIKDGKFVPMYSPGVLAADARMRADRLKGSKFGPEAEKEAIRAERKADRKKTTRHAKPRTKKTAPHHKRHTSPGQATEQLQIDKRPPPKEFDLASSKDFPSL